MKPKEMSIDETDEDALSYSGSSMQVQDLVKIDPGAFVLEMARKKSVEFDEAIISLEINKVQKLVKEKMRMFRFAMNVPHLLENDSEKLKPLVSEKDLAQIQKLLSPVNFKACTLFAVGEYVYRRTNFFTASSASSVERFYTDYPETKEAQFSKQVDDVILGIHILYHNPVVYGFCEKAHFKMPSNINETLESLHRLFKGIIGQMKIGPSEAEEREINLSQKFLVFDDLSNQIFHISSELRPKLFSNSATIRNGWKHIDHLELQKSKLKLFCRNTIIKNSTDADKQMVFEAKESERRQEKIDLQIKDMQAKLEALKDKDFSEEKEMRVKKYKAEQQLLSIINKYETDMAERTKMCTSLANMFETEQKQLLHLEMRFNEQETLYNALMKEKMEYDQSLWEAQLYEIQKRIAARKIQRYFRKYQQFMLAHGKKKGKGKKGRRK